MWALTNESSWFCRAAELFDWLRGLPEGHELGHLCDVYTYTTIISQCGSHQQLRKALELVAEMRGRGIACNVHTYSALMNVCIKASCLLYVGRASPASGQDKSLSNIELRLDFSGRIESLAGSGPVQSWFVK